MFEFLDLDGYKMSFPFINLLLVEEADWGTILTVKFGEEIKELKSKEKYSSIMKRLKVFS